MADFTRRGFLTQMSITTGVGIAGGLGLHKLLAGDAAGSSAPQAVQEVGEPEAPAQNGLPLLNAGVTLAGPMLVHVRDVATGEVSMMVGTRELVYRDPDLVSRLISTARSAKSEA
jgi:hypothetical protein